ncbi:MAG: PHP domain-containing protein [Christensenellaceae bacterium]|nr:PHP domain-containing protein [Christensenellaceae bacterium]
MIDLHLHTTASDGSVSPEEIIAMAAAGGFTAVGIADHDTVGGVARALQAGRERGVEVLAATELTVGVEHEIHLLGYGIDCESPALKELLAQMEIDRDERVSAMVQRLKEGGLPVTEEEVRAEAKGVVGRPHIAAVLVKNGAASDSAEAFRRYIGKNAPYYVERRKKSTAEAIEAVRQAGGVPVLAHPGLLRLSRETLWQWIDYLQKLGLQGLECYHSGHSPGDAAFFRSAAAKWSLLVTGGSDFHGAAKPKVHLGSGLESWRDDDACLAALHERLRV